MAKWRRNKAILEQMSPSSGDFDALRLWIDLERLEKREQELLYARKKLADYLANDRESQDQAIQQLILIEDNFDYVAVEGSIVDIDKEAQPVPSIFNLLVNSIVRFLEYFKRSQSQKRGQVLNENLDISNWINIHKDSSDGYRSLQADFDHFAYLRSDWVYQDIYLREELYATLRASEKIRRILESKQRNAKARIKLNYRIRNIRNDLRSIFNFLFKPLDEPYLTHEHLPNQLHLL